MTTGRRAGVGRIRNRRRLAAPGVNLFEMTIILLVLGLVVAGSACAVVGTIRSTKAARAWADVRAIAAAAEIGADRYGGSCERAVADLWIETVLEGRDENVDPWRRPYWIECRGEQGAVAFSRGPDRVVSSPDDVSSDRLRQPMVDNGKTWMAIGRVLIGIPLFAFLVVIVFACVERLGSSPARHDAVVEALEDAMALVDRERTKGWRAFGTYHCWSTQVLLVRDEPPPPGSFPRERFSLRARGRGGTLDVFGDVLSAKLRGYHADPEVLAALVLRATVLADCSGALARSTVVPASPYR